MKIATTHEQRAQSLGQRSNRSRQHASGMAGFFNKEPRREDWLQVIVNPNSATRFQPVHLDSPPLSHYTIDSTDDLQQRLANADDYFKRKSIEVLNDDSALSLLANLYQASVVDISDFNSEENGISLAKLTAASFVEIGANVIYITESGQRFIDWIQTHE